METSERKETNAQIHDNCRQVVVFHNHLCRFFKALLETFPELKTDIKAAIAYYKSCDRANYIKNLHTTLYRIKKMISEHSDYLFTCPDVEIKDYMFLPELDFLKVWHLCSTDKDTKNSLFKHLQSLYISVEIAMAQITTFDKALLKQRDFLKDMIENMKIDDEVKARIETIITEENKDSGSGADAFKKLGSLLGEDNFIFKLAKEVATDMDLGLDPTQNPMDSISSLLNDPKKLERMIITIGEKLQEKLQKGDITSEKFQQEAEQMKAKLDGLLGHIPGFSAESLSPMAWLSEQYNALPKAQIKKFRRVKRLFTKDQKSWTESDTKIFTEFTEYLGSGEPVDHSASRDQEC